MDLRYRRPLTRSVVLGVVVGGHVLLVLLLTSSKPGEERAAKVSTEFRSILVLLDLERPTPVELPPDEKKPEPMPRAGNSRSKPRSAARSAEPVSESSTAEDTSGTAIDVPRDMPRVDWQNEAARTAQAMAPGLLKKQLRECEEARRLGKYPPGCKKPASAYNKQFEPEPNRVGIQGLIPYVRIGKRCVVALGGFGCMLGKLPEADGSVFDDMRDPDRPRSSVPDIVDESGFGTATLPKSEVLSETE
jgi:hypothetical protein